jgi:creatinine amidohydrolase
MSSDYRAKTCLGVPLKTPGNDMHAGESDTSHMLVARPDLVHMDIESGADLARQLPESVYTGIWW